jgi:predicted Zn-ribbon and HTH transcriptional regulator
MPDNNTNNDLQTKNSPGFDPNKDIDLSSIENEIIDTSKGGKIDYRELPFSTVYHIKCLNCGYYYEGKELIEKCPKCGSDKLDESETLAS